LASSRGTQNTPDWKDCLVVVRELNLGLDCRVELTTCLVKKNGQDTIQYKATAHPNYVVGQVQRNLVSVKTLFHGSSPSLGVASIFRLLLTLDYEASKAWATKQST
jgi:hypothetical protein